MPDDKDGWASQQLTGQEVAEVAKAKVFYYLGKVYMSRCHLQSY
jgi:hypothetical protein